MTEAPLEGDVTLPFGTVPGWVAVRMHFVDHLVHGWDLAKATGQDTSIPGPLATAAYEEMTAALDGVTRGPDTALAPEVPWPGDAPGARAAGGVPGPSAFEVSPAEPAYATLVPAGGAMYSAPIYRAGHGRKRYMRSVHSAVLGSTSA